jgi:hypothetical protein
MQRRYNEFGAKASKLFPTLIPQDPDDALFFAFDSERNIKKLIPKNAKYSVFGSAAEMEPMFISVLRSHLQELSIAFPENV